MSIEGAKDDKGMIEKVQGFMETGVEKVGDWIDAGGAKRRALIFGVVIPIFCIIGISAMTKGGFLLHGFSALSNPSYMTIGGVGGIGAALAISITEVVKLKKEMSDKTKRRIGIIHAIALPILALGALIIIPGAIMQHGGPACGFATTTYGTLYGMAACGFFYVCANAVGRLKVLKTWREGADTTAQATKMRVEGRRLARELEQENTKRLEQANADFIARLQAGEA